MVAVAYDRDNVIVKGLACKPITYAKAVSIIALVWIYSVASCIPPAYGWGSYKLGMNAIISKPL